MTGWSGAEILALIPADVRRIDMGKEGFGPSAAAGRHQRDAGGRRP